MHLRQVGLYTLDSPPHFIFLGTCNDPKNNINKTKQNKKKKKRERNEGFMDRMVNNVQLTWKLA